MSIRVRARVRNGGLELTRPLTLPDGVEVEVEVHAASEVETSEWTDAGMARLEEEWDNPKDAIYDDWRSLYGV